MAAVLITQVAILVRPGCAAVRCARGCLQNPVAHAPALPRHQDNPSWYVNPLQFEIVYECMHDLPHGTRRRGSVRTRSCRPCSCVPSRLTCAHLRPTRADLEWKITYVGSAEDDRYDQVLDSVLVGPVAPGSYRFVFQADPPKWGDIPQDDILGVTVILLTCAYNGAEFIRVGYYVNNEYADEALRDNPPAVVQMDRVSRSILEDKPRVTRFPIDWGVAISTPQISDQMQMGDDAGMLTDDPSPGTHAGMGMPPVVHALDYTSMMV